jgi:hypothetical protein
MEENANCQIFVNIDDIEKAGIPLTELNKDTMDKLRKEAENIIKFRLPLIYREAWENIQRRKVN